jgi:hypothetical protein
MRISRHEATASRVIAGEAVVLRPGDGKIFTLNGTGSRLWDALEDARTVSDLVGVLQSDFEVGEQQARADVLAFVADLREKGLVTVE